MNLPEKLFKYESFSVQSLLNLKAEQVYFSAPAGFNDPYDCAIKADLDEPTIEEIHKIREIYLANDWPSHVIEKLEITPLDKLKPLLIRAARDANEQFIETFIQSKGVSCFSEVNDELLMWAHYADKYQGFCLEFNTNNELFEKAQQVNYVKKIPKINIQSVYSSGERSQLFELFCTKSKAWEYEKEWRVIHDEAGLAYTYPTKALTGIYFGPNMPRDVIEIICLVLQGQNSHVKFWLGKRSDTTFKVEFKEQFYISSLEAKKL